MNSNLAHDLQEKIWRSKDVLSSKSESLEISTFESTSASSKNVSKNSGENKFLVENCLAENTAFTSMKINKKIVDNLLRCGFVTSSPIQTSAIPLGRLGLDLIAQAKSGTGKTIVFVVCALETVIQTITESAETCPRVLILTPTREIAVQVGDIINSLTSGWENFSCFKAIGGTKVSANILKLETSQIVVGTPGRVNCLLEMGFLKSQSIRLLVLDECDKLMDENFKKQIDKVYGFLPVSKQMIVTSATLSNEMTQYLAKYMNNPVLVRLNVDRPALIGVQQYVAQIEGHCLEYLNFESKIEPLIDILKHVSFTQCFVFINYQTRAKYLHDKLISEGWSAVYITGEMEQKQRLEAINNFRKQKYRIFISTDLTSRGIDIDSVNLVVNLDVPYDCETYLHRIGRAGRFGSFGLAITLVKKGDEYKKFSDIISQYNIQVNQLDLETSQWDLIHQKKSFVDDLNESEMELSPNFVKVQSNYETIKAQHEVQSPQIEKMKLKEEKETLTDSVNSIPLLIESLIDFENFVQNFSKTEDENLKKVVSTNPDHHEKNSSDSKNFETTINNSFYQKNNASFITDSQSVKIHNNFSHHEIQKSSNYEKVDNSGDYNHQLLMARKLFRSSFLDFNSIINCNRSNIQPNNSNLMIFKYLLKGLKY